MEATERKQVIPLTNQIHLTPLGKCEWAHILNPQTKFDSDGVYSIKLDLGEIDAKPIVNLIRQATQDRKEAEIQLGRNVVGWANPPWKVEEETGVYKFTFKQKALGKPKNKDPFPISIDVLDAKTNVWPKDILIGNGSLVIVAFTVYTWNSAAQGGIGTTLQLKAVQIIEHVHYEAEAKDYGFQAEEGVDMGGQPFYPEASQDKGANGDDPAKTGAPYKQHTDGPVEDDIPF